MGCSPSRGEKTKDSKAAPEKKAGDAGTMVYFAGLQSRGEPLQMLAAHGNIALKPKLITFDEWGKIKSDKIPYMPYLEKPDGTIMLETEALCKHLGTMGGKMVVDDKQDALCKAANTHPMQTADPYLNLPESMWPNYKLPSIDDWVKELAPVLKKLAADLGDGPFFAGEKPGYGEAFIWCNLENQAIGPGGAKIEAAVGEEDVAKLKAFHAKFQELPGIKEYLAGRPKKFGMPGSHAATLAPQAEKKEENPAPQAEKKEENPAPQAEKNEENSAPQAEKKEEKKEENVVELSA